MKRHVNGIKISPIFTGAILLTSVLPAWGRDYFDAGLLMLDQEQSEKVDLTQFEAADQVPEGAYLVTIFINQIEHGEQTITFQKGSRNKVEPLLTPALLNELGVNTSALPTFSNLPVDKPVEDLPALIPHAQVQFSLAKLRLDISIPQVAMQPNSSNQVDPSLWNQGIPAFLLNYNLNGSRSRRSSQSDLGTSEQTSLFANLRAGLNFDAWRLRSLITHSRNTTNGDNRAGESTQDTQFINSYLQRDIQPWHSEILAGESSSGGDVFDSIPFRGVKLNSTEEMLPNNLRGFAPVISGVAQSNARVTVRQNGNIVYQTYVAPGPFTLNDLGQSGSSGDLTVTITEADGSVRTQTVAYSTLPVMLRPGAFKYELTGGKYNGSTTVGSQESTFGLGTLVYGLPYNLTLYGGGLVADDYFSSVVGSGLSLGNFGALSADITQSNAKLKDVDDRQKGESYRLRYAKNIASTGTSIDVATMRYSTRNYYSFSDVNSNGYQLRDDQLPWSQDRKRNSYQLRLSQNMGDFGSLYVSGMRDNYWDNGKVNNNLTAGYSNSYHGVTYGMNYSIDRIKGDNSWPENRQLSMNVQVPLSLLSGSSLANRSFASYQMTNNNQGSVQNQAGINGTSMDDRLSYNVTQGWSNDGSSDMGSVNTGYRGSKGMANMGYSYGSGYRAVNMNASGGVVAHADGVTLSQPLGDTVALVSAPGARGSKLMSGNNQVDSRGYAVVPYLSNYQRNNISLDPATLPEGVDITQSSQNLYPTKGAVVKANFATRVGYQALVTLSKSSGLIPFGAVVSVEGMAGEEPNTSIVGDAGQVYLSGLPESGRLKVKWGGDTSQQCNVAFSLANTPAPSAANPIRHLPLRCEV
ncbi:fimbria/pilus outer membrane usher protein [Yersinia massiliensis]|uniref:fimbria/pilus outer membrane usher protein n=1 Tax=Yersinia massiliensis TaxID=419257 RepID=UPI0011A81048|nr:fimbria/pilus outer membrane usher protein [Yersinia massiliensis]MCB5308672.1 fimbrial biogenesis outer membrane usher protein [Yersinia massiliensis]